MSFTMRSFVRRFYLAKKSLMQRYRSLGRRQRMLGAVGVSLGFLLLVLYFAFRKEDFGIVRGAVLTGVYNKTVAVAEAETPELIN